MYASKGAISIDALNAMPIDEIFYWNDVACKFMKRIDPKQ